MQNAAGKALNVRVFIELKDTILKNSNKPLILALLSPMLFFFCLNDFYFLINCRV